MARPLPESVPRYRFNDFTLSPRRRLLLRDGREQPLIPRYFDLLVFLIERRGEAVHRRDIFDRVWGDVVVSDSALSQAIRTIRRVLGDESREPRFVRTVPRHGYRFVFPDVVEEDDESEWREREATLPVRTPPIEPVTDPYEPLLQRLTAIPVNAGEEDDQREAAELLHALGTSEALRRLGYSSESRGRTGIAQGHALGHRRGGAGADSRPPRCDQDGLGARPAQASASGGFRRGAMGARIDWRRPGRSRRWRGWRLDSHGRSWKRRVSRRGPGPGGDRRMLWSCRWRRRRRRPVAGGIGRAIAARRRPRLGRRTRRRARRVDRAMVCPMGTGGAVRDRHRHWWRPRGTAHRRRGGAWLRAGDSAFGRRSGRAPRPPPARGRGHHRGGMRPRRAGSGIEGTAAGRWHHPSHRPGVGGIGGDVDAAGPTGRRAGFWSLDGCAHRCE